MGNNLKIGLYGGTFNPPHFGHLNLAIEIKEKKHLDEVWFIPTCISPFRTLEPLVASQHRLNMIKLLLNEIEGFKLCDIEMDRTGPSYTIDTVNEILKKYPAFQFYLIIGEDSLIRFNEWKNVLELVDALPLLIGSRPQIMSSTFSNFDPPVAAAVNQGLISTKRMEISSSEIRERLQKRLYCGHLVPVKILDYIYENQLYFNDNSAQR